MALIILGGLGVSRFLPDSLPPVYRSMERARLALTAAPGDVPEIMTVKVARTPAQRAAGFMDVPPAEVRMSGIFFELPCDGEPVSFHMERVQAPLDIAFLDERGRVLATTAMTTGGPGRLWPAPPGTCSAVELPAGMLSELGVRPGLSRIVFTDKPSADGGQ